MFTWEGPPSPFLHLPVLFLDDNDTIMDSFLSINNNAPPAAPTTLVAHGVVDDVATASQKTKTHVKIKKVGKKDRHSKIRTAQGLRDRRMRLSLKVARSFFDLQDMLGFEKASKTVEWLLDTSKVAIHRLASDKNMVSSSILSASSESEDEYEAAAMEVHETEESLEDNKPRKKKRKRRTTCKAAISVNPLAREVRDKARARARERTREKMMARSRIESNPKISRHFLRDCHDSVDFISQEHQASLGMIEQLLGISSPSSSSAFSYRYHDLAGANHNHEFQGFLASDQPIIEPAASCYAMTSTRPESIFMNSTNGEQWMLEI